MAPIGLAMWLHVRAPLAVFLAICDHAVKSWSLNQTIIAMSYGQAELYSTNKGAANAMGLRSLMGDLGIELDIRLLTNSSAAKAVILRRGLSKIRHLATNELLLQERVQMGGVAQIKIKNVFNVSDMLTKHQDAQTIQNLMELLDHHYEPGRSTIAPQMNALDDHNGLAPHFAFQPWDELLSSLSTWYMGFARLAPAVWSGMVRSGRSYPNAVSLIIFLE